ncbi:hypothetical protein [Chryseobacterium indoltheticum]|uniref:Uncharacterized protein n=1 Tax=Chryseobacterium indoltheticum TaxID=254 RepID=A0A381JS38_9FLAO|nr:hypothetical protein [Chryseobacterium indoltheticum]AZA75602.1 hypothetical protein EG358_18450 [Chryseobacterium indoltheticum]SIQ44392.1 hypothetical protein SAMN05421682_10549 [Chryseobacterium indoltheticum]SUY53730.1 Uncharacterised protein [Chryseobacterium indoltheticum]
MDIDGFRAELETRLLIEKEYLIQELSSINDDKKKLDLLGRFNEKYKELIKRLAVENGIDLNALYPTENPSNSENLSNQQIILGKTMSVYDKLADELYEKLTSRN